MSKIAANMKKRITNSCCFGSDAERRRSAEAADAMAAAAAAADGGGGGGDGDDSDGLRRPGVANSDWLDWFQHFRPQSAT